MDKASAAAQNSGWKPDAELRQKMSRFGCLRKYRRRSQKRRRRPARFW